jgi:hypothetical protein
MFEPSCPINHLGDPKIVITTWLSPDSETISHASPYHGPCYRLFFGVNMCQVLHRSVARYSRPVGGMEGNEDKRCGNIGTILMTVRPCFSLFECIGASFRWLYGQRKRPRIKVHNYEGLWKLSKSITLKRGPRPQIAFCDFPIDASVAVLCDRGHLHHGPVALARLTNFLHDLLT